MADDLLEKLAELPRPDVPPQAAARIRATALAQLTASPAERFWTERLELPVTALAVAAYLVWAVLAATA